MKKEFILGRKDNSDSRDVKKKVTVQQANADFTINVTKCIAIVLHASKQQSNLRGGFVENINSNTCIERIIKYILQGRHSYAHLQIEKLLYLQLV